MNLELMLPLCIYLVPLFHEFVHPKQASHFLQAGLLVIMVV